MCQLLNVFLKYKGPLVAPIEKGEKVAELIISNNPKAKGLKLGKIYKIKKGRETHHLANGAILTTKKELKVAVTGGYIIIEELKLSGKKKMEAKNLLNGFHFSPNAKMR